MNAGKAGLASSVKWSAVSQISRLGAQLLGLTILARLLPSADFGLIAMAVVVTGFAGLFRDFGTAAAVIQKAEISDRLLDTVFWFNVALGCAIAVVIVFAAPAIAWGFGEPRLTTVLLALAVVFPISGLGAVHQALLERASRFRPLALLESTAAFLGLGSAVLAAFAGWGVYSLVAQTLVTALVNTTGLWLNSGWRTKWQMETRELKQLMGFSGNLVGYNVFNYFVRNADNVLIGRFLGASDLGYYSMAYKLMLWPLQNISGVLGRALFPALSRMQGETARLAESYVRVTAAVVLITAPLMFGLFVLREPFVATILGERWQPVAELLFWLAPVGFMQSIGTMVGSLYLASGRTDVMFKWGIFAGLLAILAFVIGLQWGLEGVAAAYFLVSVFFFWPSLAIPFRFVGLRVSALIRRIAPSLLLAAGMALIVSAAAAAWPQQLPSPALRLIGLVCLGVMAYAVGAFVFQRAMVESVANALFRR